VRRHRSGRLVIPIGDDAPIALTLLKSDGTAFDLTGCVVLFSVKQYPQDTAFALQKSSANGGVTITNAAGGLATVNLTAAETAALAEGVYQFDVQVIDASSKKHTLIKGTLVLLQHPSR
jgi:hypothetical protein